MSLGTSTPDRAARRRERLSFFRQSGWMVLATGLAGACFALVHIPATRMQSRGDWALDEWTLFATLLDSLYLMAIPAAGLQAVFAQMLAGAIDETRRAQVRTAVRQALVGVTLVWGLGVLVAWGFQERLLEGLRIRNPAALWATLGVGLAGLWFPVFAGLLQGAQRFSWLGVGQIAAAAGRLIGITVAVVWLGGLAAGAMGGVLAGVILQLGLAMWASRGDWLGPGQPVGWGPWMGRLMGLTLGLAPTSLLLSGDSLLIQAAFGDQGKDLYLAAGRIGRGLVTITTPLAIVLFPKMARSAATGEPSASLRLALVAALGVGTVAALGCTVMPQLTLEIMFAGKRELLAAAELVPWFAWCMLPLAASITLINHLLARGVFRAVPWLLAVAAAYAGTLFWLRTGLAARPMFDAFRLVILVLGGFSVALLAVAALFSLRRSGAERAGPPA